MSIEKVIELFCSKCVTEWDQKGNAETSEYIGRSLCSQCSLENSIRSPVEMKKKPIDLNEFINNCCYGLEVSAQQVFDNLVSAEDKQDIINGDISTDCLQAHIKAWLKQGMPHYATRKKPVN